MDKSDELGISRESPVADGDVNPDSRSKEEASSVPTSIDAMNSTVGLTSQVDDANKFKGLTRFQITVEPLFFFIMFNTWFTNGIIIDLFQRNACNQVLGLNNITCEAKPNTTEAFRISAISAQVNMTNNLVTLIFPLVLSLFAGPWSDKNGRKPCIIIPMAGYTVYYVAVAIMAWFPNMNPMFFIIPCVPLSLCGTMMVVYLSGYCYLCDIFDNDTRIIRFSINWSVCLVGSVVANSSVTLVFDASGVYGYQVVFMVCAFTSFLGFLYTQFLLKETVIRKTKGFSSLIDLNYAKDVAMTLIIHPKDGHFKVLLNVFITFSVGNILLGESGVEYLIGQIQYSWSLGTYSLYSVITQLWSAACCAVIPVILRKLFSMRDATVVICSGLVLLLAELGRALSVSELMFWISTAFMRQYSIIAPIMNAMMADLVTVEDMGKLYAFTGLVDTTSGYIAMPLYTELYQFFLSKHQVLHTFFLSSAYGLLVTSSALSLRIMAKYKESRLQTTYM